MTINHPDFELLPLGADGLPSRPLALPTTMQQNCAQTAAWLQQVGYQPPWIGYIAVAGGLAVGGGAFVGPARAGEVEIAYYTLPEYEGRRYASATAAGLVSLAHGHDPQIRLIAHTLRETNASVRILQRLGFLLDGEAEDADAGRVWRWQLGSLSLKGPKKPD